MRLRPTLIGLTMLVALSGCAAEHRLMRPAADTRFPALSGDADRYADHREAWTRREPLGVKGQVEATFEDPGLGADYLAYLARTQGLGEVTADGYFRTMWDVLYGPQGDRLPILVTLRFDPLFHSPLALKPERWDFVLEDDAGRRWKPIHLSASSESAFAAGAPPASSGKRSATYRLWFQAMQPGTRPLIDGRTRELTLHVTGLSGAAALRWKFKPVNPTK